MRILVLFCVVSCAPPHAFAQQPATPATLALGSRVEAAIQPDQRHSYVVPLEAGDYVSGAVEQRGSVVFVTAFHPDGSLLRPFPGPFQGPRRFAFIAETTGVYRLELRTPSAENAARQGLAISGTPSYVLTLAQKQSRRERASRSRGDLDLRSPAISKLVAGAESPAVVEAFWEAVKTTGSPLIEPVANDGRQYLTTFLWRGNEDTSNVAVVGSFTSREFAQQMVGTESMMRRVGQTDVWYLTLVLPRASRLTYRLSPDDPLLNDDDGAAWREANLQIDPLNARRTVARAGATKYEGASVAELPGAASNAWTNSRTGVSAGSVEALRVPSAQLNQQRDVWLYTPAGFASAGTQAVNLLIFFDGEIYRGAEMSAPTVLDNLAANQRIAPTVAVFVPPSAARAEELLGGDRFSRFVATELVPWVSARFHTTFRPERTAVVGLSAGGVAAAYTAFHFPKVFGNVISQSGAFDWAPAHPQYGQQGSDATTEPNEIARLFRDSPVLPIRFYLEAGTFETDLFGTGGFILEPTRHLRDVLKAKGYQVDYHQFTGGHEALNWRQTLPAALLALLR